MGYKRILSLKIAKHKSLNKIRKNMIEQVKKTKKGKEQKKETMRVA